VPFVLKAGKALNESKVELRVQFHAMPGAVSALSACPGNELVIRVQPQELIYWKVQNRVPGFKFAVEQVRMDLHRASCSEGRLPSAYERLVLEALAGDRSHFVSPEELQESWKIFTPALSFLANQTPEQYAYGGRGPAAADALARRYGMKKFGGGLSPYVLLSDRLRSDENRLTALVFRREGKHSADHRDLAC